MSNPLGHVLGLAVSALAPLLRLGNGAMVVDVRYHRALTPNLALTVVPTLAWLSAVYKASSVGVKIGARWTASRTWLGGLYAMPQAHIAWLDVNSLTNEDLASGLGIGIGAELGYTWIWTSGFVLEAGFGLGYSAAISIGDEDTVAGIRPTVHFGLGYGW